MSFTPRLGLSLFYDGQAQAEPTMNGDLNLIDTAISCAVINFALSSPPGSPDEGDTYIVAATGTGDWASKDNYIAVYYGGWLFITPTEGFIAWDKTEDVLYLYDGSAWIDFSTATGLATTGYVDSAVSGLKWKQSVVVATTANGTLATAYENGDTVDGVVLVTGNRILLKDQSSGSENGIYTVNASGSPTRATDADSDTDLVSACVFVQKGTVNADKAFICTNDTITIGITSLVFVKLLSSLGGLIAANNLSDLANAGIARTNLGLGTVATLTSDTDGALAANSDSNVATQKATKTYADLKLAKASNLSDVANAGTSRTNLGLGTAATLASDTDGALAANSDSVIATQKAGKTYCDLKLLKSANLSDVANAVTSRANLGLAIGTNVQAYNALLLAIAVLGSNGIIARTSSSAASALIGTAGQSLRTDGAGTGFMWSSETPNQNERDGFVFYTIGGRHTGAIQATSANLSSGRLHLVLIRLRAGQVLTNISFLTGTTGATSPTNWWVALFNSSRVLITQSADQGSTAIAGSTIYTLALGAAQTIAADANYYVGLMIAASVVPQVSQVLGSAGLNGIVPISNGTSDTGLTTTAPGTAAAITATAAIPHIWGT